jgi:hypothetical protein
VTTAVQGPGDRSAHDGLLALFTGDPDTAAAILPKAIAETPAANTARRAMLTAYLGVAYGNLSVSRAVNRDQNRERALQYFSDARSLDANVTLSPPLVSPAVMTLFKSPKGGVVATAGSR